MHRSVLENAEFAEWASENVIVLVAHPKGSHKSADVAKPGKGEPKKQCTLYPGLACEDHEKAFEDFAGKADEKDKAAAAKKKKKDDEPALPHVKVEGFPASYVILPDGTVTPHKADREPGSCRSFLEERQKAFDEHSVPWSKAAEVHKAVADAEKAAKASQWKATLAALAKVDESAPGGWPKSLADRAKPWLDAANAKAAARFAEAKAAKDAAAQVKAVKAVRDEFGQTLSAGPLPVIADVDAWLSEHGVAPAPSAPSPPAEK